MTTRLEQPKSNPPMRSWPAFVALTLLVLMALYAVINLTQSVPVTPATQTSVAGVEQPQKILQGLDELQRKLESGPLQPAMLLRPIADLRNDIAQLETPESSNGTRLLVQKLDQDLQQIEALVQMDFRTKTDTDSIAVVPTNTLRPESSGNLSRVLTKKTASMQDALAHELSVRQIHLDSETQSARDKSVSLNEYGRWALVLLGLLAAGLIALALQQLVVFRRHPVTPPEDNIQLKAAIEGLPDGCVVLNPQRQVTAHNSSLKSLLPESIDDIEGVQAESLYSQICHDSTQTRDDLDYWLDNLQADSTSVIEVMDHRNRHLLIREKPTSNGDITAIIRDISDIKEAQRKLQRATDYDSLTGLPNRALFMRELRSYTRTSDQTIALMVCDLRDFRQVNDSYGQHVGDQLLIAIGQCLQETMPVGAIVARISGDEFAVMIHPISDKNVVEDATRSFLDRMQKGLQADQHLLPVRASIGISYGPDHGISPVELKNTAESACAQAKRDGANSFSIFNREQQAFADREHTIDVGLLKALENNEFQIEYQPQIDIRTNMTSGMEALIRWNSKTLGRVSPAEFIPQAEKSGLIVELGDWVLRKAIEDYLVLTGVGMSPGALSVNISRRQFDNPNLVANIEKTINDTGMTPELLTLEIT
ncbi:MAG: diguanylate cyclase, partial [Granulosicoccus sp.]|nr:diguanylate cyclase [Granulosicoccus sp.]